MKKIFIKQKDNSEKRFNKNEDFYKELYLYRFNMDSVIRAIENESIKYIDNSDKRYTLHINDNDNTLELYEKEWIRDDQYNAHICNKVNYIVYDEDIISTIKIEEETNSGIFIPFRDSQVYKKLNEFYCKDDIEKKFELLLLDNNEEKKKYTNDILGLEKIMDLNEYDYIFITNNLNNNILSTFIIYINKIDNRKGKSIKLENKILIVK